MVKSMNKTFNGEYSSKSETTYKNWLGTTTDGTAIGSLVNVLNDKYGGGAGSIQNFGSWGLANPRDKWAYLAIIETDTGRYKQPVIQGVRTEHLPYWNNHSANHFNVAYGYNKATDPKKIYILEVYDRVKVYGAPYADGTNPYGHRQAPLAAAFEANDVSCPNCGDRRRIIQ